MEKQPSLKASRRTTTQRDSPACLQERPGPHMEPWALGLGQKGLGQVGILHLRVGPMIQWAGVENLQQGMRKKQKGRVGGMHWDRLVRTSLLPFQEKVHWGRAQRELLGQKEMVQLDRGLGHQVAVLELLQVDTAQETGQGLQDWRETALELPVDTAPESRDQGEIHQELKEVLGTAPVPQDPSETGTVLELLALTTHQSHREQRAGWGLRALNLAIPDSQEPMGFQQGRWD